MVILKFLPGLYLGWGLGSNDAANVFGPQVNSGTIRYRNAVILAAIFITVGAILEGGRGFSTIGGISDLVLTTAIVSALAAALTVSVMSRLGLPVSTSQAIIGSIIGISLFNRSPVSYAKLTKVFVCWFLTPIGAAIFAFVLYNLLARLWQKRTRNLIIFNSTVRMLSILIGCYAAYGLGANNVANVMGTFVGANLISPFRATVLGGVSICTGVLTYSRNVMYTVGKKITPLDPFSALIAVLAEAITLHIFAMIGVPVSSSQAVVGAVVGVGLVKGMNVINRTTLVMILVGWILGLLGSGIVAYSASWVIGFFLR
jgi:PiT family inorganic phosphate transporter